MLPFENSIPCYEEIDIAAGGFGSNVTIWDEAIENGSPVPVSSAPSWVELLDGPCPGPGHFVARVRGRSMDRRVPAGSWCLFRRPGGGSREGRVVLARHLGGRDGADSGRYTLKVYHSVKEQLPDGSWRHVRIELLPDSTDPAFEPVVCDPLAEDTVRVIAELVRPLG